MKYFGMLVMGAMMAFGFTACGSDDDNNDGGGSRGGKTSVIVNGKTFSGSYAFYNIETTDGVTWYELWISNCNLPSVSDPWECLSILYPVKGGSTTQMASGEFSDYQVAATSASMDETKDVAYYAFSGSNGNTGKVKVTVSGNTVSVEVPALNYVTSFAENAQSYAGGAFSFSGSMSKIPSSFLSE